MKCSAVCGKAFMDRRHYELRILPLFEEQLSETVFYISERLKNPIAADNFIDAVEAAIYERLQAPEVKNYFVFYVVIGNVMEVRALVYNRRDLSKII